MIRMQLALLLRNFHLQYNDFMIRGSIAVHINRCRVVGFIQVSAPG